MQCKYCVLKVKIQKEEEGRGLRKTKEIILLNG